MAINPGCPQADEFSHFFADYVALVGESDLFNQLEEQHRTIHALLAHLSIGQLHARPTPTDWNALQVLGHIINGEQVFAYRALRIARGDTTPLPGFEQDDYVATAQSDTRGIADLLEAYDAQRRASLALLRSFDQTAWLRRGTVSGNSMSARALGYIIAGHELYHIADFRARYNIA